MKRNALVRMTIVGVVLLVAAYGISEMAASKNIFVQPADQLKTGIDQVSLVREAIEAGDNSKALEELGKLKAVLQSVHTQIRPAVINVKCPMMGTKIDRFNVSSSLFRTFRGKGVGFCCPACLEAWDGLTDDQRADKLSQAIPENVAIPTQLEYEKDVIDARISRKTGCKKGCDCAECESMRTELSQKFLEPSGEETAAKEEESVEEESSADESAAADTEDKAEEKESIDIDEKVAQQTGCPKGCSCAKCQEMRTQLTEAEEITGIGVAEEEK